MTYAGSQLRVSKSRFIRETNVVSSKGLDLYCNQQTAPRITFNLNGVHFVYFCAPCSTIWTRSLDVAFISGC